MVDVISKYNKFIKKHVYDEKICKSCFLCLENATNLYKYLPGKITISRHMIKPLKNTELNTSWNYLKKNNYITKDNIVVSIIYPYKNRCYHDLKSRIVVAFDRPRSDNMYYPVHLEKTIYNTVIYNYLIFYSKYIFNNFDELKNIDYIKNILYPHYNKIYKYIPGRITIFHADDVSPLEKNKLRFNFEVCELNVILFYTNEKKVSKSKGIYKIIYELHDSTLYPVKYEFYHGA